MRLHGSVVLKADGVTFVHTPIIPADSVDVIEERIYAELESGRAQAAGLVESLVVDAEKASALNLPYYGRPYWWSGWELQDEIPIDGQLSFEVGPGP